MSYVLTNNTYYVTKSETGKITMVENKKDAYIYSSLEEVKKDKTRAYSKLVKYEAVSTEKTKKSNKTQRIKFDKITREAIYNNANCRCQICNKLITYEEFTVDIIPLAHGGTNDMSNLQASCKVCNKIKADILPNEFEEYIANILLHKIETNHKGLMVIIFKLFFKKLLTK